MAFLGRLVNALGTGMNAFRESMLNADPQSGRTAIDWEAFGRWDSRRARYRMFWALYQNNIYQELIHPGLAAPYKKAFALYKHTRSIYSPAHRIGAFWAMHLMGGSLDHQAGNGKDAPSALPIETENELIRPAIAQLWLDSNWQAKKGLFTLKGSVYGDIGLRAVDDTASRKVYLAVVEPAFLEWVDRDAYGNVQGYLYKEQRLDPRVNAAAASPVVGPQGTQRTVEYAERVTREDGGGPGIVFETFLGGTPYDWREYPRGTASSAKVGARWVEPYGFVPLWLAQHEPTGLDWGFGCFHHGLSRFREVDDQASGLSDQIRKAIRAPKLVTGVSGIAELLATGAAPNAGKPQPDRSELPYLTCPNDKANVHDLTFNLDIPGVIAHIAGLLEDIERNYPELLADVNTASGDASGRALKVARQQAASRVQAIRPNYDDCLKKAMAGAIAIGGHRYAEGDSDARLAYAAYAPFNLDSYAAGDLDFRIGHRAVFEVDPSDQREANQQEAAAVAAWVNAGVPLEDALRQSGWEEADIERVMANKAKVDAAALEKVKQQQILAMADQGGGMGAAASGAGNDGGTNQ